MKVKNSEYADKLYSQAFGSYYDYEDIQSTRRQVESQDMANRELVLELKKMQGAHDALVKRLALLEIYIGVELVKKHECYEPIKDKE